MQLELEIIAICGDAGSGKDSVASRLVAEHGYHLVRIAEPLWRVLECVPQIEGFLEMYSREVFKDDEFEAEPFETPTKLGRHILIDAGAALREQIGHEAWLSGLVHKAFDAGHRKLVIPDLRFPAEADELRMLCNSLCVVRVVRPDGSWGADEESRRDATETSNAEIREDWHLANSGTLEELTRDADELADFTKRYVSMFQKNCRAGLELLWKRQRSRANG